MHWPAGFAEQRMPSRGRLARHGVSFDHATCNTAMCSPSRATMLTGLMPAQHGVTDTLTEDGPVSATERVLDPRIPNLATMLREGGYDVHWRGKWHLCKGPGGGSDVIADDVAAYGFDGWVGPDAGGDTRPEGFGAGRAGHDAAYIEQAVEFLTERAAVVDAPPFCLVVSLVNPHDVLAFPGRFERDYEPADLTGDVELPPSVDEDLEHNLKPTAHAQVARIIDMAVGKLETREQQLQYANFYANLTERIDRQLSPLVDLFYDADGTPTALGESTLIVRTSDHGELAMSHGGLRQKAFNVYEETLSVPLIFSNPRLFPQARTCPDPASLVDLMPTLASMLGVEAPDGLRGTDLGPSLRGEGGEPAQDHVLFTFDDMHAGTGRVPEVLPGAPGRIRCIRERRFKFARYHDTEGRHTDEFEMYDLVEDPDELENLAHPDHPRYADPGLARERERLAAKLEAARA